MTMLAYTPNFNGEQAIYGIIFVLIIAYNFRVGFLKVFVDDDEDAVRFAFNAGNIDAGTFKMYGIA